MADREQTYKNHARLLPPFHLFVIPILLINFLNEVRHVYLEPSRHTAFTMIVAAALLMLGFLSRTQALTVQDRVIRLEERLRMRQLLPPELHQHIDELTYRQLIALRFASDAELADLVREVVAGKLATSKEIKLRVRNWRADWLRA
jgi:cell division protein FtsL